MTQNVASIDFADLKVLCENCERPLNPRDDRHPAQFVTKMGQSRPRMAIITCGSCGTINQLAFQEAKG